MLYLFHLSGEAPELALAEVKALFEAYNLKYKIKELKKHIVTIESPAAEDKVKHLSERSALIKSSGMLIGTLKNLKLKSFDAINWGFVKCPFVVRVEDLVGMVEPGIESRLASPIWNFIIRKGKIPTVNLENPKTTVYFIIEKKKIYVQKLVWKAQKGRFENREPQKKPAFHPTGLKPKLARLLVNLSRVRERELLLDAFCGTSSVLIEAALIGIKIAGNDIDEDMINSSKINLKFYKIRKFKLVEGDALKLEKNFRKNSVDAIATDPPYGRSSRIGAKSIVALYSGFLKSALKVLKKGKYAVLLYPHYIKFKIPRGWKTTDKGSWYVHGGLTRKCLVLQKS